ncbi:hypothetical protein [Caballeronia novacaledonica]|uniref:Uncharacterized protein n=1 Tax=Caballeronia novacaledonica TaxID=1544861 RepID=A0AA37MHL6_9BURK|nr:hypothetical protein [Caballeronia novacaledonica]GJH26985.1 hypothetical protein CBA19CS42_20735 [Caballeronia novacaledonica]
MATVSESPKVSVLPHILRDIVVVYGLTILSAIAVNWIVRTAPIGPWVGPQVEQFFWLDNVAWQLFALWWIILIAVSDFYPFNRMQAGLPRGLAVIAFGWFLGWLTAKAVYVSGLGAGWLFPIIGTIYFFVAFFSFTGENWIVAGMPPHRKFGVLLLLIAGLTYAITSSSIRWIPAWWFPFLQIGVSTGLLPYLTRGMKQPGKSLAQMCLLSLAILGCTWIGNLLGVWSFTTSPVSTFWLSGTYTPDNVWLLFFMVGCSINFGLPVLTSNWPFRFVPMPWGALLACAFYISLSAAIAVALSHMVGNVFANMSEALSFAYMGVNWSIGLCLIFGLGFNRPYLWAGQTTVGSWEEAT